MMKPMLFRFGTVFAAILILVVCTQAADKSLIKLTVGYTPISGAALPLFIAVEEKLFQKHGLEVFPVFMGGSPLINSAILAGEFQLGYTAGGAVISSRLAGSDLITIACPLPALVIDAWARPEIKSVADLRGKRIGVTRFGASTHFAGLSMLDSAGIKPNEVVFIQNGGVGESLAALIGGRVDASMIGYPFGLRAKAAGLLAHVFDQFRALNAVWKPGEVFDERSHRKLTAGFGANPARASCSVSAIGASAATSDGRDPRYGTNSPRQPGRL